MKRAARRSKRRRIASAALVYGTLVIAPTACLAILGFANIARIERELLDSQRHHARLSLGTLMEELTTRVQRRVSEEQKRPYFEYNPMFRPAQQLGTNPAFLPNALALEGGSNVVAWFQVPVSPKAEAKLETRELQVFPQDERARREVFEVWDGAIRARRTSPTTNWNRGPGQICLTYPLEVIGANANVGVLEEKIQKARGGNPHDNADLNFLANDWIVSQNSAPTYNAIPTLTTIFACSLRRDEDAITLLGLREVSIPRVPRNRFLDEKPPEQLLQGFVLDVGRILDGILQRMRPLLRERGIDIRVEGEPGSRTAGVISASLNEAIEAASPSDSIPLALVAQLDRSTIAEEIASRRKDFSWLLGILACAALLASLLFFRSLSREWRLVEQQRGFVSAVTHELRTPVAGIRLFADMLEEGWVRNEEERRDYFATLKGETNRLERLVDDILHVAAFDRGEPRVQPQLDHRDLGETLREAVEAFRASALSRGAELVLSGDTSLGPVSHDGESIRRVLFNLFENAAKYTPADRHPRIHVQCTRTRSHAEIEVADNARGIPAEHQRRIFDDFYRIGSEERRCAAGAGLGLGVVRRHIEAHGGRIQVESSSREGTRFRILLPV